jgi:hypothetical protein
MTPLKTLLASLAVVSIAACAPSGGGGGADGAFDQAAAENTLLEWARATYNKDGASLIEPPNSFFGDFTGDGVNDALLFSYYDVGGSSAMLATSIHRGEAGGAFTYLKDVEVYGMEPRDAAFSVGSVTVTTLMPGPNDPHCCPTQPQEWTVETN